MAIVLGSRRSGIIHLPDKRQLGLVASQLPDHPQRHQAAEHFDWIRLPEFCVNPALGSLKVPYAEPRRSDILVPARELASQVTRNVQGLSTWEGLEQIPWAQWICDTGMFYAEIFPNPAFASFLRHEVILNSGS
jgi:hypothetical protein